MLIQPTILTLVIMLHLGARKGYTQLTHLELEHDDDYYRDICELQDSFKSPYIRAFYDGPQQADGCNEEVDEGEDDINIRSTSMAQETHIIQVLSSFSGRPGSTESTTDIQENGVARISLRIKSPPESSAGILEKKLVFVLVSSISIRWKIHLERIKHSSELHFWVTNGSHVVHDRKLNMKVHQLTHRSSGELLLDWISQRLGPVTTMVEVKPSRNLVHVVGITDTVQTCREITPMRTEVDISGCLATLSKGRRNKDVHVLELRDNPADTDDRMADSVPRSVTVNIHPKSNSKPLLRKQLMLVLKSHRPTRWKILTTGLRGTLDIVTDNAVDTSGVTMQTVGVVTERLSAVSGIELVVWTSEKYGEPISYTYARMANNFDLTVDGQAEVSEESDLKPQVICNPSGMVIGLTKSSLVNKFPTARLSLSDWSCRAQKNRTHYFWSTSLNSCGTIQTLQSDQITYKNYIIIRHFRSSYGQLSDHSGSGFEAPVDDEIIDSENSGDVRLDFNCVYPRVSMGETKYELKLYKDPGFQLEVQHFPAIVSDKELLFIEASAKEDPLMKLVIHNCTILSSSSDQQDHWLIRNGCPFEERVQWLKTSSSSHSRRFQFIFEKSWSGSNLKCVVSTCAQAFHDVSMQVQPCPSQDQLCSTSVAGGSTDLASAVGGSVSIGPFVLQEPHFARTAFTLADSSTQTVMMTQDELHDDCDQIVLTEGLDPAAVVGIAFAAFTIGVLLTGALWFIHSHTGPIKKHAKGLRSAEASGESTPCSTAPIAIRPPHHHI